MQGALLLDRSGLALLGGPRAIAGGRAGWSIGRAAGEPLYLQAVVRDPGLGRLRFSDVRWR